MKLRLFLLLVALYMAFASREQPWGDSHVVYATTQNLVDNFRIDVSLPGPPQFYVEKEVSEQRVGKGGKKEVVKIKRRYGVFPLGNVVAMAPGYLAWKVLRNLPGIDGDLLYRYTSHLPPSLMIAGACVLFMTLARKQGATERVAFWLALALGTTTVLVIYARSPFSEALQTLAFTWVVERGLSVAERPTVRGAFFGGVACGLLFNSKLVYALAIPVVPAYWIWRNRRDLPSLIAPLAAAAVPMALLAALAVGHNYYKTHTLFDTGYQIPGGVFSGNAYAALFGFFLSPGKSIFLYSPPLLLGLLGLPTFLRLHKERGIFLLVLTGIVTLANAKFRYWHADYCWGPRLLVPLTPAWLLFAAPFIGGALERGQRKFRALAVGGLIGAGLYAQVLGCAFYWDHYIRMAITVKDETGAAGWYTEDLHQCHFIPQFSPLIGHAWMLRHFILGDDDLLADAPWRRVIAGKVNLGNEWSATTLDLWQYDWLKRSGSPKWGWTILALWTATGLFAAVGLRRRLRERT